MSLNLTLFERNLKHVSDLNSNATFYMYRDKLYPSYTVVLDFQVGAVFRDVEHTVTHCSLISGNYGKFNLLEVVVKKLLAQKETIRLCTKFWTGVEIE